MEINFDLGDIANKIIVGVIMFCLTTVFSFFVGRWWGAYKARKQWESRHFFGQINVSFNLLLDKKLRIRTIFEKSLEEVYSSTTLIENLKRLAKKTTKENPMIPLEEKDAWFYLNAVLNSVAEKFSIGFARQEAGESVRSTNYLMFLTSEVLGEDRLRKIRVMLVKKEHIENFPFKETLPVLEKPYHIDRVMALKKASEIYKNQPYLFIPLEIIT